MLSLSKLSIQCRCSECHVFVAIVSITTLNVIMPNVVAPQIGIKTLRYSCTSYFLCFKDSNYFLKLDWHLLKDIALTTLSISKLSIHCRSGDCHVFVAIVIIAMLIVIMPNVGAPQIGIKTLRYSCTSYFRCFKDSNYFSKLDWHLPKENGLIPSWIFRPLKQDRFQTRFIRAKTISTMTLFYILFFKDSTVPEHIA